MVGDASHLAAASGSPRSCAEECWQRAGSGAVVEPREEPGEEKVN